MNRLPLLLLGCIAGGCLEGTFRIAQPPRYTSCRASLPPARPGYPAGSWAAMQAAGARCGGGDNVSGFDVMYQFNKKGSAKPTEVAFQEVSVVGDLFTPGHACGDTDNPIIIRLTEYFNLPANDVQARIFCCEDVWQENATGKVGIVDTSDLPKEIRDAMPPIPATENAQFVSPALTAAQRRQLAEKVQADRVVHWAHRYEYDGCHPVHPATVCGDSHCYDVNWSDSDGGGRVQDHGSGQ